MISSALNLALAEWAVEMLDVDSLDLLLNGMAKANNNFNLGALSSYLLIKL